MYLPSTYLGTRGLSCTSPILFFMHLQLITHFVTELLISESLARRMALSQGDCPITLIYYSDTKPYQINSRHEIQDRTCLPLILNYYIKQELLPLRF